MDNNNLEFLELNKKIFWNVDILYKTIDVCVSEISKTQNLSEENKLEWACGIEYFRDVIKGRIENFISEIQLDELGLGGDKTKKIALEIKK